MFARIALKNGLPQETAQAILTIGRESMALFYFPVRYGRSVFGDGEGEEFASVEDAKAHATRVAVELGRNSRRATTVYVISGEDASQVARAEYQE